MRLNFGSILHACRTRAGISQERLAELLNKSRSCISKYEQGHKLPDIQTFLAWLDRTNAMHALAGWTQQAFFKAFYKWPAWPKKGSYI
jgi:transcriptional regulator with XRE-family HTH domain